MAAIALRSPQYKTITAGTNAAYATCSITIDGAASPQYVLRKNTSTNATVLFEISELCLDYLNITFNGTYTAQTLSISTVVNAYTSSDSLINGSSFTDVGYDAYGTFMEGANPEVPFSNRPRWLLNTDPESLDVYYIYVPNNTAGVLPYIAVNASMGYVGYGASQTSISASSNYGQYLVNIVRVDCTKYGDGHKITFVNKFGALQDIWFFLKSVNTTNKKSENYQRNIISSTGTYSVNSHTKQVYNTIANTNITLSSGFYPEWSNQWFEQLLLSEQVWLTRTDPFDSSDIQVVPVNVKKNSIAKKTVLNNKLIEYTFDFDMSFDYINNVR
tara:strand:- start:59 stop:1048 length:990 start_codon:yes stop_codon:yes gene_type:complete